jgi:hypothetical protein
MQDGADEVELHGQLRDLHKIYCPHGGMLTMDP